MAVALSSLRVVTEGDSSSYVKSMEDVATSSDKATVSVTNASSRFEKLQRSLDPAYSSQVRLAQAQNTLGSAVERGVVSTGRYNDLMGLAGQRFDDATRKANPLAKGFESIGSQIIALSAGLGPVGVALAGFGPVGLLAAVGLGAAASAFQYLSEQASALGEKSAKLNDFSETAGITAVQLQALEKAATGVGLSTEKFETSFMRFSVELSQLQLGKGNLYTELETTNQSLVRQLSVTHDVAKAWDILSDAYVKADERQKALIERAVGGVRGGGGIGRVFSATEEAGGISGLQGKLSPAETIDDATTERLGKLKVVLDQLNAARKDILASTYAEEVLQTQVQLTQKATEYAESVKEGAGWWQKIAEMMSHLAAGETGTAPAPFTPEQIARSRLATGLTSYALTGGGGDRTVARGAYQTVDPSLTPRTPEQQGPQQASPEVLIAQQKALLTLMGSAATASEQLKLKTDELSLAYDKNAFGIKGTAEAQNLYNRAVASAKLDNVIALEGKRLGLLGELAPVSEIIAQKENQIWSERTKGVNITKDEAIAISFLNQVQTEGSRLQEKITAGVANETQIRAQLANELQVLIDKKLVDPTNTLQMSDAQIVLGKSFQSMSEKAELARAPLEQLRKFELDASNVTLQIDTAATSTMNQMTTSIVDFTTGTKTGTAAFQDFGKAVIKTLEEMIVKMLLARSLGLIVGGGATVPGASPTFSTVAQGHTGGIGWELGDHRSVNTASFMNAPRFHSGYSPEEMPAIIRRDEGVFTPGQMRAMGSGGGGGNVQVNVYNQAQGTSVKTSKRSEGGVNVHDIIISTVNSAMANGKFDGPLRARTGTQLQPRGR